MDERSIQHLVGTRVPLGRATQHLRIQTSRPDTHSTPSVLNNSESCCTHDRRRRGNKEHSNITGVPNVTTYSVHRDITIQGSPDFTLASLTKADMSPTLLSLTVPGTFSSWMYLFPASVRSESFNPIRSYNSPLSVPSRISATMAGPAAVTSSAEADSSKQNGVLGMLRQATSSTKPTSTPIATTGEPTLVPSEDNDGEYPTYRAVLCLC